MSLGINSVNLGYSRNAADTKFAVLVGGNTFTGSQTFSTNGVLIGNATDGFLSLGNKDTGAATIFNEIKGPVTATAGGTLLNVRSVGTLGSAGSILKAQTAAGTGLRVSETGDIYVSPKVFISGAPAQISIGGANNTNTFSTGNSGSHNNTDFLFKAGAADRTAGNIFQISNFNAAILTVTAVSLGGNVGIGTITPSTKLDVDGTIKGTGLNISGDSAYGTSATFTYTSPAATTHRDALQLGISNSPTFAGLTVNGHFSAQTKSFLIDHPTKEGKKLQYGVLEGPSHDVFFRGKTNNNVIELPEYWRELVREDTITVTVAPIGKFQPLFVISQDNKYVEIGGIEGEYNFLIMGERKDVDRLEVEI